MDESCFFFFSPLFSSNVAGTVFSPCLFLNLGFFFFYMTDAPLEALPSHLSFLTFFFSVVSVCFVVLVHVSFFFFRMYRRGSDAQ